MKRTLKLHQKTIYTLSLFFFCISHLICASESSEEEFSRQRKGTGYYSEAGSGSYEEKSDSLSSTNFNEEFHKKEKEWKNFCMFMTDECEEKSESSSSGSCASSTISYEVESKSVRRTARFVLSLSLSDLYEGSEATRWKPKEFPLEFLPVQIIQEENQPFNQEENLPQLEASSGRGILIIK